MILSGGLHYAEQQNPLYHGSAALWSDTATLTMFNDTTTTGVFGVKSIDVGSLYHSDDPTKEFYLGFSARRENGQIIDQWFKASGASTTLVFDYRFDRIMSLSWVQDSDVNWHFQVDNIVVDTNVGELPEPFSLTLMGIGIAGLAAARRKRPASSI